MSSASPPADARSAAPSPQISSAAPPVDAANAGPSSQPTDSSLTTAPQPSLSLASPSTALPPVALLPSATLPASDPFGDAAASRGGVIPPAQTPDQAPQSAPASNSAAAAPSPTGAAPSALASSSNQNTTGLPSTLPPVAGSTQGDQQPLVKVYEHWRKLAIAGEAKPVADEIGQR